MNSLVVLLLLNLFFLNLSFAGDQIVGTVILNGKALDVQVDRDINTGTSIVLDQQIYKITRINETNIAASRNQANLEVYTGGALASILTMSSSKIGREFDLQNKAEVKCMKGQSKAFLIYSNQNLVLGNCIN